MAGCVSILVHPNRLVEAEENQYCGEGISWEFDDDIASDKDLPRIGFRRPFAHFVQRTLRYEVRHDLLYEIPEDGEEHKDTE